MVQTNEEWANAAKLLRYVDSQEEMNGVNQGWELNKFEREAINDSNDHWYAVRKHFQNFRYFTIMNQISKHFAFNYGWVKPGLEVKYALEEAEAAGAKTYFLGPHFDRKTVQRFRHEARVNVM